jgi:hypothetical protein
MTQPMTQTSPETQYTTGQLVEALKEAGQDEEFYPTTPEILRRLLQDIKTGNQYRSYSLLDIGAGNGKTLAWLASQEGGPNTLLAIEKSEILLATLPKEIFVIGTDFHEQSLLNHRADITFSNPPYSQFEPWSEKIIRQTNSQEVYLVLPTRWKQSSKIQEALDFRDAEASVLGTFDFHNSPDRAARATVDLIKITIPESEAFERFFNETFPTLKKHLEPRTEDPSEPKKPRYELLPGRSLPETLVEAYQREMAHIEKNYHVIGQLDPDLLHELEIDLKTIQKTLRQRLENLKSSYWSELISRLGTITDRLTSKSRQKLLGTLNHHAHVDFTLGNIYAIIVWLIKNSNDHIDSQLTETFEKMVEKANVTLYKSNQRTWVEDRWRYNDTEANTHYALDYRIVSHRIGGCTKVWRQALSGSAASFLGDLLTVARNLGFNCRTNPQCLDSRNLEDWPPGKSHTFVFGEDDKPLMEVKAFLNGNMHLRLNQDLIRRLNVEYGRLKGWIKSPQEAAEELGDPKAAKDFQNNYHILPSDHLALMGRQSTP